LHREQTDRIRFVPISIDVITIVIIDGQRRIAGLEQREQIADFAVNEARIGSKSVS
jgi:hypothetical protein